MDKKLLILLIIIVLIAAAGGFFYLQTLKNGEESAAKPAPPKLFSKGDYKVEERADGKYIVVDKVGLTAKVPDGWRVEFEGNDMPDGTSQYWVNLMSPDAEVIDILTKGCGISILSGISKENFDKTKEEIIMVQKNPQLASTIRTGYTYAVSSFGASSGLKWTTLERPIIGQVFGIDIPISDIRILSFETRILPDYKTRCFPAWEEFVKMIEIK